ncbi:glycosyltransferase family 4 protein [Rhizobium sp. LC145]|uniref:glycosyltransferase family 4 protein n=1 Tax=Rhizobium sp. LC145 TaxID=1120688 RepID=UPI000A469B89|nr:glycosyltransferase family 4 protein [Rhizobium sp. LC145]
MEKKTRVSQMEHPPFANGAPDHLALGDNLNARPAPAAPSLNRPEGARRERVVMNETPRLSPALIDTSITPDLAESVRAIRRRVVMLGLRGIPDIQGGIEKHVEMLGQELLQHGWDVEILGRRPYLRQKAPTVWRGIRVVPLWAPRSMLFEAIAHTFLGVLHAAVKRPDILHIHAIGPGILAPIARLAGLKVVVTHHGYDYDREKWGPLARRVLRLGERLAMRFASASIGVSGDVARTMKARHCREVSHIPNGVNVRPGIAGNGVIERFGLERRRYIVMVARIVPEKRQNDLIAAFETLGRTDWKLVLVGAADHDSPYSKEVEAMAARVPGVVMAGFQSGEDLAALFSQAGLFVLPSIHEGMPIALLEALSYGLPVLASDIPANREVELPATDYFPVRNVAALAEALARKMSEPFSQEGALARIREIERAYGWSSIGRATAAVYRSVVAKNSKRFS